MSRTNKSNKETKNTTGEISPLDFGTNQQFKLKIEKDEFVSEDSNASYIESTTIDFDNVTFEIVKDKFNIDNNIYVHCNFDFKDNIKKAGFKWDAKKKLWYISINNFTKEIFNMTRKVKYANSTSIGILKYYHVNYIHKSNELFQVPVKSYFKPNKNIDYSFEEDD